MTELFDKPLTIEKDGYGTLTITPREYLKKFDEYTSIYVGHEFNSIEDLEKIKGIEKMELYHGDDPYTMDLLIYGPVNEAGVLDTPMPADIMYGKKTVEEHAKTRPWYQGE